MTRISQLIAVVGGVTADSDKKLQELGALLANEGLLSGLEESHRPYKEGGVQLPSKSQKVRLTADRALKAVHDVLARKWDIALTLDAANSAAYGDVVVDGSTLLAHIPVGHLLYLERELGTLHSLVSGAVTRDQAKDWTDAGTEPGLHKSAPVETVKTDKVPYNWHRGNGTANIQEQVDVLTKDEISGFWTKVTFSGALDPKRKADLLDRISALRIAVKMAREEANAAKVDDQHEGDAIFAWLLRP